MPVRSSALRLLRRYLVACASKDNDFLAAKLSVSLSSVVDVGRRTDDGVDQARVGIDLNVGLQAKVPLVALLGLVHLRFTLATAFLARTESDNQRNINIYVQFKHLSVDGQSGFDGGP